jgi:SAM-dependent methyltransferase
MAEQPIDLGTIFSAFAAYQRTGALKAAVELDLFTAIAEGTDTPRALAARLGAAERGIRILCDALAAYQYLRKRDGRYALDEAVAPFLDTRSPAYVASAIRFIASKEMLTAWADVAAAVRHGGTVRADEPLAPEHPMWVEFARAMAPLAAGSAELLANLLRADAGPRWKILDIAAGAGLFGITLARHDPNAEVVAVDWPNVLAVAAENARRAGVAARWRTLPGSAFEVDFGGGYDLVLLTNFLHHFDRDTCIRLLRKVRAALAPGGRAVTLEFVPDAERTTPPEAATFALAMLVVTPAGDAYTFADLDAMFREAGFGRSELHPLPPSFQRVVVSGRD